MIATALVATVVSTLPACGGLRAASSGQIGCATRDIVISNDKVGWSTRTWMAECNGKRFFCSAVSTGKDSSQVNCKEETPAADSAPPSQPVAGDSNAPAAGGCQYDTQCKGDRVCVNGACVAPAPPKADDPQEESPPLSP